MARQQAKDEQEVPLNSQYQDISDDCESTPSDAPLPRRSRRSRWQPGRFFCLSFLFITSTFVSGLLGAFLAFHSIDLDKECALHTNKYSPVLEDVDIKYEMKSFNGSFKAENIYRQPGSPEVDEAWEALGVDSRASIISEAEGLASGLTPHHVQVSAQHGGGFFVSVEGMHHLHCLNLVRKGLWYNYGYYRDLGAHAFKNDEPVLRLHVSHCLDTVRQALQCGVDTSVLGQVWYDPDDVRAFPDFNTRHRCKNFDAVRSWAVEHQAPPEDELPPDFMRIPTDEDVLPAEI